MRSTILCLLGNPVALARLRDEIDRGVAAGAVSSPVRDAEARRMPYLQAVIREGIRMFPPATGLLSKEVPAGVQVGHNIFGLLRTRRLFGPDAEVFRPERWLEAEADPDRLRDMVAGLDLVFGYGKFQCLGRTIAQMELNKIFVEVRPRLSPRPPTPPRPPSRLGPDAHRAKTCPRKWLTRGGPAAPIASCCDALTSSSSTSTSPCGC